MLVSVGFSTIWTVLALRWPGTTWHGLPAAVAGAWPATARFLRGRCHLPAALRASAGGLLVAVLTVAELALYDSLRGPGLLADSAALEAVIAAVLGAAIGAWILARPVSAPFGRTEA